MFANQTTVEYKGYNAGRQWSMNAEDIQMIKDNFPEIQYIEGILFSQSGGKVTHGDHSGDYDYKGIDEDHPKIEKVNLLQGRTFNHLDMIEKRKFCIIGQKVYEQLFSVNENSIGQQISINGLYFTVVGVVNGSEKMNVGGNINESIMVPLSTMQQIQNEGNNVHMICVAAYDNVNIKDIEKNVENLIKSKHNIAPNDESALSMFNIQEFFLIFKYLFLGIRLLTWIVGMGTLLAGVVGISNIMLVSIRERTNEIGIRRALGAKPNIILRQIMSESLLLTFLAGYIGFFLGVLVLSGIDKLTQMSDDGMSMFVNPQISFWMAVTALMIILLSGLLAGIIPARSALKIKAIDALRDE